MKSFTLGITFVVTIFTFLGKINKTYDFQATHQALVHP